MTAEAGQLSFLDPPEPDDRDVRYTLFSTIDWCAKRVGVTNYDLDVAAESGSFWGASFYSKREDGLKQPWHGNVWCNPPYSDIEPWVAKAWEEITRGKVVTISMLLPSNRTEQRWWQNLIEPVRDVEGSRLQTHFLPGRQKFGNREDPKGLSAGSPPFGVVLLFWAKSGTVSR